MRTGFVMRERLRMMTIDEAAHELHVPAIVIQQLVDMNALSHYRLGQHGEQIRIIRCELKEFQSRTQPPMETWPPQTPHDLNPKSR
jgi:excisionase family DNA binding protein